MAEVRIEDRQFIDASPSEVWKAIEDPAAHAAWHPFVIAISGEHRAGAQRTCSVLVGEKTGEVRERCVEAQTERTITWLVEHDTTGFTRMASGAGSMPRRRRSSPASRSRCHTLCAAGL